MKKSLLAVFLFSLSLMLIAQQPTYSRVKIFTGSKTLAQLQSTGIEIISVNTKDNSCLAEISEAELNKLKVAGFRHEIVIHDVAKFYAERALEIAPETKTKSLMDETWPQPANFALGSCGGFSTVDQMLAQIDLMRSLYPSLISVKQAVSDTVTTIEGRTMYYVRISDNPDINEAEPEVLYTGMHHAREPIGMQHLLYYMWYLLENYGSDPSVKHLVDNTEMYFIPVINVDGYTYNITNNPNGGGQWRKNRRNNNDGSFGIDINRNYGYEWGYDDIGSSPDPSSEIYRGTAAFSEPETRMMKYFCESHNFPIALNYHSYSNLFLYAWGWTSFPSPDNTILGAYAKLMTKESGYTYGPGSTTIYPTNGGSDDWMYGEQTTKPTIFAYTPEIGSTDDGFWPIPSRIVPLCQENMLASITAARLLLNYGTIKDNSPLFIWEQSGYLPFEVLRMGMQDGSFTASIIPLGSSFQQVGDPKLIQGLNLLEKQSDSISYQFNNTLHVGDTIRYVLSIDNGYFIDNDTIMRIFGYPVAVFDDKLTTNANWTGNWSLTNTQYFSPNSSMTDSPFGNYAANANKTITLKNGIDLNNTLLMVLQFRAKWALEADYDYVQVSISTDNGASWMPLQGIYTNPASVYQPTGQPVYDGSESDWVRETISLNEYMGQKIKIRFQLRADMGTEMDGFYFDDVSINMVLDPTSINETEAASTFLDMPFPNPATGRFEIKYKLPENIRDATLQITTVTGTAVLNTQLSTINNTALIDIGSLASGIYFVSIVSEKFNSPVRKLIVK
ncbi:MAG: M14 family zinc carboxypeptidase [Bacteroidales bacterium]